jgi:hypothetical protein
MNKETSLHGFTVMEGYVGYLLLDISQLQTVFQYQQKHQLKTLPLLRHAATTNPPAISKSVNLYPTCTHPVKAD